MLCSGWSSEGIKIVTHLSNEKIIEVNGTNWREDWRKSEITRSSKIGNHAPFVLRRGDILAFTERRSDQKFLLFKNYVNLGPIDSLVPSEKDRLAFNYLEKERASILSRRIQLCAILAKDIDVNQEEIPNDATFFMKYCTKNRILGKNRINDKVTTGIALRIADLDSKISRIKREQKNIIAPYKSSQNNEIIDEIKKIMLKVSGTIKRYFLEMQQPKVVRDIELVLGEGKDTTIEYRVTLNDKVSCKPEEVLSEGNYDLLGLLTFLAILKSSSTVNQPKILVLDDVMQGINYSYRIRVAELISKEFNDWQIIITTNDRIWFESVADVFRRSSIIFNIKQILSWSKEAGPILSDASADIVDILNQHLENGSIYELCSLTGLVLESLCHTLSWSIPISIERKKNDRYTLGDLWPGIEKALRKSEAHDEITNVSRWLLFRNMIGAHFNEWARNLTDSEIKDFACSVIALHDKTICNQCHQAVASIHGIRDCWICRCGRTKINKTK
jgi:hypothetical protein